MPRHVYLIAYDVTCPKRYRKIHKSMQGCGDRLQYSVFRCELDERELLRLQSEVWPVINLEHDRMMIVNLGPLKGRGEECIEFWGRPIVTPEQPAARII